MLQGFGKNVVVPFVLEKKCTGLNDIPLCFNVIDSQPTLNRKPWT